MISSAIDGRVRFRSPILRDVDAASELRHRLDTTPGIIRTTANTRTGSLLVEYLPAAIGLPAVIEAVGLPTGPPAAPPSAGPSNRKRKMRVAKRGMLAALAAMLLFAAADREREHIVAGMLFVAFNAYHLYGYRRTLLR